MIKLLNVLQKSKKRTKRGFTIIEMMVALTIGLIIIGGVLQVWLNFVSLFDTVKRMGDTERQMSGVADRIANMIRMAGMGISNNVRCDPTGSIIPAYSGFLPGVSISVGAIFPSSPSLQVAGIITINGNNMGAPTVDDQLLFVYADPFVNFPITCRAEGNDPDCGYQGYRGVTQWRFRVPGGGDADTSSTGTGDACICGRWGTNPPAACAALPNSCPSNRWFCQNDYFIVSDYSWVSGVFQVTGCDYVAGSDPSKMDAIITASVGGSTPQNAVNLHKINTAAGNCETTTNKENCGEFQGEERIPRTYISKVNIYHLYTATRTVGGRTVKQLRFRTLIGLTEVNFTLLENLLTIQYLFAFDEDMARPPSDPLSPWPLNEASLQQGKAGPRHYYYSRVGAVRQDFMEAIYDSLTIKSLQMFMAVNSPRPITGNSKFAEKDVIDWQQGGNYWLADYQLSQTPDGIDRRLYMRFLDLPNMYNGENLGGGAGRFVMNYGPCQ